jgi:hypothetical protein
MSDTTIVSGGTYDLSMPLASGTSIEFLNDPVVSGLLVIEPAAFENLTVVTTGTPVVSTYLGGPIGNFQTGDEIVITNLAAAYAIFDHAPASVTASQNAQVATGLSEILAAERFLGSEVLTISPQGLVTDNTGLLESGAVPSSVSAYIETYATSIEQALFDESSVNSTIFIKIAADANNAGQADGFITTDGTVAICYLRGTRLLTPTGERNIEDLRAGDELVTRFGGIQAIKWIGEQRYDPRFVAHNPNKIPVRIKAGALGERRPARDLWVSPGHSMLLGDTLVLASNLVNGVSITQGEFTGEIHYYLVEFERHDCVIAEGVWAESFADGPGLRAQFHNVAEFEARFPGHVAPAALALCAARPERGPALDAALRPVVARAAERVAPGALRGSLDLITADGVIEGWAQDEANPELAVLLEVFADGVLLGTVLACDYRADLQEAGLGSGRHMFSFRAPAGGLRDVVVRRAGDGAVVPVSDDCKVLAA